MCGGAGHHRRAAARDLKKAKRHEPAPYDDFLLNDWLDKAALRMNAVKKIAFTAGKLRAASCFYHHEPLKTTVWPRLAETRNLTCARFPEEAF